MKIKLTPSRIKKLRPKPSEYTVWDSATPHFGVRVTPTGAMRFIHLAPVEGRLKKKTIGDARVMPLDEARAIANDIDSGGTANSKPCPLFREWVDDWWPQVQTRFKSQKTLRNYRSFLEQHLLPTFGEERLDAIDIPKILPWFERYSRVSPGSANNALGFLSTIFNSAKRAGVINTNPARRIKKNPKCKKTRFLSDDERHRLLDAIDALPAMHKTKGMAIRMLMFTGCRLNEVLSLKWEEVGAGILNLADSKTGARRVWLGPQALAILHEARAMQDARKQSEYVFPTYRFHRKCFANLDNFWIALRSEVGILDVRLHDLRHSFATEAVRQGVTLPVVSKLLGHSSMKMTMRYTHASNSEVEAAAERIGTKISTLLQGD